MTQPAQPKPSCQHLAVVTVAAPYQVCFDGTVYLPGDTVADLPVAEAERWVANGWAAAATKTTCTEPAAKPAAKK